MTSLSKREFSAPSSDGGVQYPDHLLNRVAARIAPFFSDNPTTPDSQSLAIARQVLAESGAITGKELQMAAQISALGMAVLICLSAASERGLPVETMLRITDNAIKLSSMSTKNSKTLDARRQERRRGQAVNSDATQLDEAEFNAAIGKARDFVAFARTNVEAHRVATELASAEGVKAVPPPIVDERPAGVAKLPPLIAEDITASALAQRKSANKSWAKDLGELTDLTRVTRH